MRLLMMILALLAPLAALPAAAQNPFAPRVVVDERVITRYDVAQRVLFLQLFNTPGDLEAEAIERLIDERLQLAEARRMGIRLTDEQVLAGMEEFASRVDLTAEEFLAQIGQAGVAAESFRAFVEAGIAWREVLRLRFGGRVPVLEIAVDRALDTAAFRGVPRVLLSEIILPATDDNLELAEIIAAGSTIAQFAEAAELYSASDTRSRGGRLDWLPLAALPEGFQAVVANLSPGQVSPPIVQDGAILLLQLRALERTQTLPPSAIELDYIIARVPAAAAAEELSRLRARADTCADFTTLTANLPEAAVTRETRVQSALPADLAADLARMNRREIALGASDGTTQRIVMLCSRTQTAENRPSRDQMREAVLDRNVAALSDGLLAELRAAAIIQRR